LTVSSGATLAPAGTNTTLEITTGANVVGAIAATNGVVLNGTTVIKLNGAGTNDVVQSTGAGITYGGTLSLVNISGAPLAAGDSFQIFSANSYAGAFASITPSTPGPGLLWNTNQLNSGVLSVVAAPVPPMPPVVSSVVTVNGALIVSGTNGVVGGNYVVMASTNIAAPLEAWVPLATNAFDSNGNFVFTNSIGAEIPQQFYLLKLP
jgi:hypothetical protein